MQREKIKIQTKTIKLIPSDDVLDILEKEANELQKQINLLKTLDVSNVKPMVRIDESTTSYLREDEPNLLHETLKQEDILSNAPKREGAFIAIRKAVEND